MRHLWLFAAASCLANPAAADAQRSAIRGCLPLPAISVSGHTLLPGGQLWLPFGVNIIGLLAARPSDVAAATMYDRATVRFSPETPEDAQAFGASVVRLQASQPRLDPQSPDYVPDYLDRVVQGVREAQQVGLIAIISMQWEKGTRVLGLSSMPDAATARAWTQIATSFVQDRSLVYELFNELNLLPVARDEPANSPRRWQTWQAVTQPLIDQIRWAGAPNVPIVDGMPWAHTLEDAPPLRNLLSQLAYAVHPYPTPDQPMTPAGWDERFGTFALTHPVVVTEWIMESGLFCQPGAPQVARSLLAYSLEHRIGFIARVVDAPGSLVKDFPCDPTTY